MKRLSLIAVVVAAAACLLVGCGRKTEAGDCAGCGHELAAEHAVMINDAAHCRTCAEKKADAPATARHDCAGGCGMTDWPEDEMVQVDGQWYCRGCAAHQGEGHDHGGHDHDHG